jgi:hypothetical protein
VVEFARIIVTYIINSDRLSVGVDKVEVWSGLNRLLLPDRIGYGHRRRRQPRVKHTNLHGFDFGIAAKGDYTCRIFMFGSALLDNGSMDVIEHEVAFGLWNAKALVQ